MPISSNLLKSALLAMSFSVLVPMAAHAAPGGLANDPSLIAEINAAYGTNFVAHNVPVSTAKYQTNAQK
ncbi:MAG: hypothetical protein POH28_07900 [Acidocella sp.]|nr:hypothetical protein [Acidocella sp.]